MPRENRDALGNKVKWLFYTTKLAAKDEQLQWLHFDWVSFFQCYGQWRLTLKFKRWSHFSEKFQVMQIAYDMTGVHIKYDHIQYEM